MTKSFNKTRTHWRFGIGEWYGRSFIHLTTEERRRLAQLQHLKKKARPTQPCPARAAENPNALCTKEGGVCSLRLYELTDEEVLVAANEAGRLVTTCPYRFREGNLVVRWVGENILGHSSPQIVTEIGFLERAQEIAPEERKTDDVGRIDMVLVHPETEPLRWCALEDRKSVV